MTIKKPKKILSKTTKPNTNSGISPWSDLAKRQVKSIQDIAVESAQSLLAVKGPGTAFDIIKSNASRVIALTTQNVQEATGLGVWQFQARVDSLEKKLPIPLNGAFAPIAKAAKLTATSLEKAVASMGEKKQSKE
jgi:hypothetical protein